MKRRNSTKSLLQLGILLGTLVLSPMDGTAQSCRSHCPTWLGGTILGALTGTAAGYATGFQNSHRGKKGQKGTQGNRGPDGTNGFNGMNGQPGIVGAPGAVGPIGPAGPQGFCSCPCSCEDTCQPTLEDFQNEISFAFSGEYPVGSANLVLEARIFDPLGNQVLFQGFGPGENPSDFTFLLGPETLLGTYRIQITGMDPGGSSDTFQVEVNVVSSGPGRPNVNKTFHTVAIPEDTPAADVEFNFQFEYDLSCSSFTAP